MAGTEEFTGLSDGEGVIYPITEEYLNSIEGKGRDDFMKWVVANEERARKIICNLRQFAEEQFCDIDHGSDFELTFL